MPNVSDGFIEITPESFDRLLREMELREFIVPIYEVALWHLLSAHKEKFYGYDARYFNKSFRQLTMVDGHTDMAIWNLMRLSHCFWQLFGEIYPGTLPPRLTDNP